MTQIIYTVDEEMTATRLNQGTQGFKFLRRTTYAGSSGSPVGSGPTAVSCATWAPGSGTAALFVRTCGPGGGGGSAQGTANAGAGSGGGGGGYSEGWIFSGFGSSQNVKIGLGGSCITGLIPGGPGGASEFGSLLSASSGLGGGRIVNQASLALMAGGPGGMGSGGVNLSGAPGGAGVIYTTNLPVGGRGGQSALGGGGGAEVIFTTNSGNPGGLHGGGGSGAAIFTGVSGNRAGGPGAPGCVVVDEYA